MDISVLDSSMKFVSKSNHETKAFGVDRKVNHLDRNRGSDKFHSFCEI